mgnify:CR=1 FL=1
MTRYEQIKEMTLEEMSSFLCECLVTDCGRCKATEYCHLGHTGFTDWLNEEVYEIDCPVCECKRITDDSALEKVE